MPEIACAACKRMIAVEPDKVYFHSLLSCPHCGSRYEVINERPLRVESSSRGKGSGWITEWNSRVTTEEGHASV